MPRKTKGEHPVHDKPGHLIRRLQQIAVALFAAETEAFGITAVQYAALAAIRLDPGMDQTALVNAIALDRSTLGDVVSRLESKSLIRRAAGREDRRTKVLYVTREGEALLRAIEPHVVSAQRLILAPLKPAERTRFMAMLKRLVQLNNDRSRAPLRLPEKRGPVRRSRRKGS
jgi:DNA-binding MarR family transcriptional regulator